LGVDSSLPNGTIIPLFNLTTNSTTIGHFDSITVQSNDECKINSGFQIGNSSSYGILVAIRSYGCSSAISLPTFIPLLLQLTGIYIFIKSF